MSKEKTPIEEIIERNVAVCNKEGLISDIEELINAKVLEALENCCGMSREQAVHARKRMKQK